MTAKVNKLIAILRELQNVSYEDATEACAHNANANAVLSILFHIGRSGAYTTFTEEHRSAIAGCLHSAIVPIQINIERHGFEFRRKLNTLILKKRSALQFLVDLYGSFHIEGQAETLAEVFERVNLSETIGILDKIIDYHRSKRKPDVNSDLQSTLGIPSTHAWWFINSATVNGNSQKKENVEAEVRFMHESTRATAVSGARTRRRRTEWTVVVTTTNDPTETNIIQKYRNPPATQQLQVSDWQAFLNIFRVESLDEIKIHGLRIFQSLTSCQKKTLKYIVTDLRRIGTPFLKRTVETILQIFRTVDLQDISFFNFIILAKFVMQCLSERMVRRNELHRTRQDPDAQESYYRRRVHLLRMTSSWIVIGSVLCIIKRFQGIRKQIKFFSLPIKLRNRNLYSAVYYYFKHRFVGRYELSVEEYFDIVKSNLSAISTSREFEEFLSSEDVQEFRFEKYYAVYGTRLLMKMNRLGDEDGGGVDLTTCYFEDDYDDDDDCNVYYVNGRRIIRADGEDAEEAIRLLFGDS